MVCIAPNFYYLTVEFIAYPTEIGVQFCFYGWMYQRFAVLGAEYDVQIIFC